jgi:branched-chain amino acid transport system substrate-binding protein
MRRYSPAMLAGIFILAMGMEAVPLDALAQPTPQPKAVKIGLIAPLSGPWARQGYLKRLGADMAIEEINSGGGIRSLGGARIELVVVDAGDSPEKAKNAAQRLISQQPELVGGMGAFLSSFTLAVTEVTERARIPWLSLSFADTISERGFRYVFQTSPVAGTQAGKAVPALIELAVSATGKRPRKAAIIMDNTASPVAFTKPMREGVLRNLDLELVADDTFTPPLSDATPIVQKLRSNRPDLVFLVSTSFSDDKLVLEKMTEFKLGRDRLPVVGNGEAFGAVELLRAIGKEQLEGLLFVCGNWGFKGQEKLIDRFKQRTGEPWLTQSSASSYGHVWILKEALEAAKSADRERVAEAIRKMDTITGPAAAVFAGGVSFEPNGRRKNATVLIVQWQNGVPVTVFPPEVAMAQPIWPKGQ